MSGQKYRVRCIGQIVWDAVGRRIDERLPACGWTGVRTDRIECECYDINTLYCRPLTPGPGCPRGIDWPCPHCGGAVTGKPVEHRAVRSAVSSGPPACTACDGTGRIHLDEIDLGSSECTACGGEARDASA